MSFLTLIRAWLNFNGTKPDFNVWQCMEHTDGKLGACCQRLRGHAGLHRTHGGTSFRSRT